MVIADDADIFTWSDTAITATMDVRTPQTYEDGEVVGTITWTAGPQTATAELVVEGRIEPPTAWWRLTPPFQLGGPAGPTPPWQARPRVGAPTGSPGRRKNA